MTRKEFYLCRKHLLLVGCVGMVVTMAILGITMLALPHGSSVVAGMTLACLSLFMVSFGISWGVCMRVVVSELLPLNVRFICNGGCPKDRTLMTPDGEPGLNYLCAGYKAFFTHIDRPMKIMAQELHAHRPPANIMDYLAREEAELQECFARAGRNDPCPCGSGRKFKKCHGA